MREHGNIGDDDITIQWFVDGIETFISSRLSIWAILFQVNELPYRSRKDNMLCCGICFASKKPPMNLFLKPFIDELIELHNTGFLLQLSCMWNQSRLRYAHFLYLSIQLPDVQFKIANNIMEYMVVLIVFILEKR